MSKVLIVHNAYRYRGGEDECVDRELALLQETDLAVRLWRCPTPAGVEGICKGALAVLGVSWEKAFCEQLQQFKPDIVHVHNLLPILSPKLFQMAKKSGARVVLTQHNFRPLCLNGLFMTPQGETCERCAQTHSYAPGITRGCYRDSRIQSIGLALHLSAARQQMWYQQVDRVIAPSEFLKDRFVRHGFWPASKVSVQPHFLPDWPTQPVHEAEPYALYLGRLSSEKGIDWLIDHWPQETAGLSLVIAGQGPLNEKVRHIQHPSIRYVGYVQGEQKAALLSRAAVLILPSRCYENLPLSAIEANAYGVPLLVSRAGGLAELVETGENGTSFSPQDPHDFATKLNVLARQKRSLNLRQGIREWAAHRYRAELFLKKRLSFYQEMIAGVPQTAYNARDEIHV